MAHEPTAARSKIKMNGSRRDTTGRPVEPLQAPPWKTAELFAELPLVMVDPIAAGVGPNRDPCSDTPSACAVAVGPFARHNKRRAVSYQDASPRTNATNLFEKVLKKLTACLHSTKMFVVITRYTGEGASKKDEIRRNDSD